jgi:hypothetical protein
MKEKKIPPKNILKKKWITPTGLDFSRRREASKEYKRCCPGLGFLP